MAKVLETGQYDELYTIDLHNDSIKSFFSRGINNLTTTELFTTYYKDYLKKNEIKGSEVMIVAPDHGSSKRADMLVFGIRGAKKVILNKLRPKADEVEHLSLDVDVKDKVCIILDDIISTGKTIVSAAKLLKKAGAKRILVAATHGVFAKTSLEDIFKAGVKDIVITNTIEQELPKKVHVLDILQLIMKEL